MCAVVPYYQTPGFLDSFHLLTCQVSNTGTSTSICEICAADKLLPSVCGESNLKPNYMNKCLRASIVHKHDGEEQVHKMRNQPHIP